MTKNFEKFWVFFESKRGPDGLNRATTTTCSSSSAI